MKIIKRLAAVGLYLLTLTVFLKLPLGRLFNPRQMMLTLFGMVILYLPGVKHGTRIQEELDVLADKAVLAGFIQTFILFFITMTMAQGLDGLIPEAAMNCRPVLYGFCIWTVFSGDGKNKASGEIKELTATECYYGYLALGLTKREAEIAVLVGKGMSNGEIAGELCISEATVKKHLSNIFEKLKVTKREQIRERLNAGE